MTVAAYGHAAGLVHVLDHAGRTIAALEERVDQLEGDLAESRQQVVELTGLLAQLRGTTEVPPVMAPRAENGRHVRRRTATA